VCQLIFTGGFHRVARASSPAYPSHPRPIILSKNQKHTLTGWKNNPGDKKCNGIIREKEEGPILFPSFFVVLLMTEWCDVVRLSGRFHAHFWGPVIIIPDGEREREREREAGFWWLMYPFLTCYQSVKTDHPFSVGF